jgi:hypothetical protein
MIFHGLCFWIPATTSAVPQKKASTQSATEPLSLLSLSDENHLDCSQAGNLLVSVTRKERNTCAAAAENTYNLFAPETKASMTEKATVNKLRMTCQIWMSGK